MSVNVEGLKNEDSHITTNGRIFAKLKNSNAEKEEIVKSLFGIIPADMTLEEAREERIDRI